MNLRLQIPENLHESLPEQDAFAEDCDPQNNICATCCKSSTEVCRISGFRRGVNKILTFLRRYAVYSGSHRRLGTTYRSHLQGSSNRYHFTVEDGSDMLSRNVTTPRNIQEEQEFNKEVLLGLEKLTRIHTHTHTLLSI